MHKIAVSIITAMGKTAFSFIDLIKENTSEFQELGDFPTSPATVATLSFMSISIAERFSLIMSIKLFLIYSSIF